MHECYEMTTCWSGNWLVMSVCEKIEVLPVQLEVNLMRRHQLR